MADGGPNDSKTNVSRRRLVCNICSDDFLRLMFYSYHTELQKCVGDLASEERGKPGCVHIGKQRVGQQALISSTTISEAGFRRSSRQNALKSPAESTKLDRTDCSPSSSEYEDSSCEEEVSDADTTKVAHAPAQCPMTGSAVGEGTPSSGRKVRYIAFIGNLPFTVTGDDIVEHFQKKGVNITEVRMLTKKGSGESRGCCFAEFRDAKSLQAG